MPSEIKEKEIEREGAKKPWKQRKTGSVGATSAS
jgi:hypothetical protein